MALFYSLTGLHRQPFTTTGRRSYTLNVIHIGVSSTHFTQFPTENSLKQQKLCTLQWAVYCHLKTTSFFFFLLTFSGAYIPHSALTVTIKTT